MKKIAILFLLTIVFASFVFAQEASVTTKTEFQLRNVSGAKPKPLEGDGKDFFAVDPYLILPIVQASASIGDFTLSAEVAYGTHFGKFIKGHGVETAAFGALYNIAAGPGNLGLFLNWNEGNSRLEPGASYSGLVAGPATLGFNASYQYNYSGNKKPGSGSNPDNSAVFSTYDTASTFVAGASASFDFGLSVSYTFKYQLGAGKAKMATDKDGEVKKANGISEIAAIDISYNLSNAAGIPLTLGVATENTGVFVDIDNGDHYNGAFGKAVKYYKDNYGAPDIPTYFKKGIFKSILIKPYASYQITDAIAAGLYVKLANVVADKVVKDDLVGTKIAKSIILTPGVWLSYTF
jgi:hypothetical protein